MLAAAIPQRESVLSVRLSPPSRPPSHPSRLSQSTSSFPLAICSADGNVYVSAPLPLLPLLCLKSVFCICAFVPALNISSSVPFF